jgi:hypothetical protein
MGCDVWVDAAIPGGGSRDGGAGGGSHGSGACEANA